MTESRDDARLALSALVQNADAPDRDVLRLVRQISDALGSAVAVAERRSGRWRIAVSAVPPGGSLPTPEVLSALAAVRAGAGEVAPGTPAFGDGWTGFTLSAANHELALAAIAGRWDLPVPLAAGLSHAIERALSARASSRGRRAQRITHRLARRLGRTHGVTAMCQVILGAMADAVRARTAAIAILDPTERQLRIVATRGYPLMLVEHLRIDPGSGIIGRVFRQRKVIRAGGDADAPIGRKPRLRHRTDSFIGLPVSTSDEVLAVACVTDREDDQPFTRRDVSLLRALAAPAALALAHARALERAEVYAHAAAIDPVSGLFNRRYFQVRIDEELQRSKRQQTPLSLLMLDLDDFKAINDSFGHLAGDLVIKETAEIIRQSVRSFDVCARYGGEEFAIIMPGGGAEDAVKVAERIRGRVEAYRPPDPAMKGLTVTVSIGLAVSAPGLTASQLVDQADQALYHAKHTGKNRVRTFEGAI